MVFHSDWRWDVGWNFSPSVDLLASFSESAPPIVALIGSDTMAARAPGDPPGVGVDPVRVERRGDPRGVAVRDGELARDRARRAARAVR